MKITWLTAEMGNYSSGAANHNRIFTEYLSKHPEVEKISVVRYPMLENGMLPPEKQTVNGIVIYNPRIQLQVKNAIKSFTKEKYKFKEKLKLSLLKLALKLKGLSYYDSAKITKAGKMVVVAIAMLSLEKPFPNPFWTQVAECIKKTHPDIIHSQVEHLSVAGALAREGAKAHVSTQFLIGGASGEAEEGTLENQFAERLVNALDWLVKSDRVDIFLPVSEAVKDYLINMGVDQNKTKIIQSPIVIDNFPIIDKNEAREKLALPHNKRIILSVGRMILRKRFQDLIEILNKLPKDTILYIKRSRCITDDLVDTSKKLISLIKKYKLTDRVIIDDSIIPYDQLVYVYSACDVAIFPFLDEPFGMSVAESMACKKPIIVYNSGYFPYFVNNNGYLVEPLDLDNLYEKTKMILDDEKLAKEMGEKSREIVQKYDINILGEKLVNLYQDFL